MRIALKCQGRFLFNPARCNVKDFHADTQGIADAMIKYNYPAATQGLPTVFCLFGTVSSSNVVTPVLLRPDGAQFHKFLSVVPFALEWQRTFAFFAFLYGYEHLGIRVAQNGGLSFGTRAGRPTNNTGTFLCMLNLSNNHLLIFYKNNLTPTVLALPSSHVHQSLAKVSTLNSICSILPVAEELSIPTIPVCLAYLLFDLFA